MAEPAKPAPNRTPGFLQGLSGKLLLLTLLFVMVGEILIFLPSIANFRLNWLKNRVAQAEIAALAVEAAPDKMLSEDLKTEILAGAGVLVVSLKKGDSRQLILRSDSYDMIDASYDLRDGNMVSSIVDAFNTLVSGNGRVIGVTDIPPNMSGEVIDVALEEAPLRAAMFRYALNVFKLSLFLSALVGCLIFLALHQVLVKPMRRLSANMQAFGTGPENPERIIQPSGRSDEIGIAEHELHDMQVELSSLLNQKSRLAALGLAVSKVSHDLRNMLSSAHLISDRLSMVNDPTVQKFAPKLIASLDRAISLCVQTLKYGRAEEALPRRDKFMLALLVDEVIESIAVDASNRIVLYNNVPQSLSADADRDQLFRVLTNLVRNAAQAIEQRESEGPAVSEGIITIKAWREGAVVTVNVTDNGPGIPEHVRGRLFEAFQSAARPGGTGLGLTIAADLVRAHGGQLWLTASGPDGTSFMLTLPDRVSELRTGKRGARRSALDA
ncbi:sensor histidine kinase [Taklimakanibacter lacteus]|uniref:sensor histidine kinase n=1 Tax=Taklimakanibacter lacteus TaxID=2268456 RepID=UPI000E6602D5